jgi:hypothetical protein
MEPARPSAPPQGPFGTHGCLAPSRKVGLDGSISNLLKENLMFRADLFADDLADTTLDQLAEIIHNAGYILEKAVRTGTTAEVMADGHLADQSALIAAELRRRGF